MIENSTQPAAAGAACRLVRPSLIAHARRGLAAGVFALAAVCAQAQAPSAPVGLAVSSVWSGGVSLSWSNAALNFDSFELQRSTDGVDFVAYLINGPTTHTDAMLNAATTYTYRLRAVRAGQYSAFSNVVTATTLSASAPSALAATATSPTQVSLSWTDNAANESAFEIRRAVGTGSETVLASVGADVTAYVDSTAAPGTAYRYAVHALTAAGPQRSNVAAVTTPASGEAPPAAPFGLVATPVSASRIDLAWSDQASDETGYAVERAASGAGFAALATLAAGSSAYSDTTGLVPGETYRYRVRALKGSVASAYSNEASASPAAELVGWTRSDVGAVLVAGSASGTGTTFSVSGSGEDIWDGRDEFGFLHRAWQGDGTIVVRVAAMDYTHGWAKAGVMIRESLAADARHVFLALAGGAPAGLYVRDMAGGATTYTASATSARPLWLMLGRVGNTFQAHTSPDGQAWTSLGSPVTVNLPANCIAGLAVTSHVDGTLCQATFEQVSFTGAVTTGGGSTPPTTTPPPPAPTGGTWQQADVGSVGVAGSADGDPGSASFVVRGSGADIWERADGFRFLYRRMTGDCVVEGEVTALTQTDGWAKAGVMMRESTAPGARHVFALVTPSNVVAGQIRATADGTTTLSPGAWGVGIPCRLRVVRTGDRFAAYYATGSGSWTLLTETTLALGTEICVGFAVTSHNNGTLASATFADPYVGTD